MRASWHQPSGGGSYRSISGSGESFLESARHRSQLSDGLGPRACVALEQVDEPPRVPGQQSGRLKQGSRTGPSLRDAHDLAAVHHYLAGSQPGETDTSRPRTRLHGTLPHQGWAATHFVEGRAHTSPTHHEARCMSSSHNGSPTGMTKSIHTTAPLSTRTAPPPLLRFTTSRPDRSQGRGVEVALSLSAAEHLWDGVSASNTLTARAWRASSTI